MNYTGVDYIISSCFYKVFSMDGQDHPTVAQGMHRWRINIHPCSTSLTPFRWQHTPSCWGIRRNRYRTPIVCTIRHCSTVYSVVFDTNTETNNNYNIHERNENSSSKRTHPYFWSIQWNRVHGLKNIVADIFMQWLIHFDALMRRSCSPLKFVAVGLIVN